jgi:hypothetical protein
MGRKDLDVKEVPISIYVFDEIQNEKWFQTKAFEVFNCEISKSRLNKKIHICLQGPRR